MRPCRLRYSRPPAATRLVSNSRPPCGTSREHRRSLRAYGLEDGERLFDVQMDSPRLSDWS
jgi:hypothetical protein